MTRHVFPAFKSKVPRQSEAPAAGHRDSLPRVKLARTSTAVRVVARPGPVLRLAAPAVLECTSRASEPLGERPLSAQPRGAAAPRANLKVATKCKV